MLKNGFLKYVVVQLAKEEYPPITEGLQENSGSELKVKRQK